MERFRNNGIKHEHRSLFRFFFVYFAQSFLQCGIKTTKAPKKISKIQFVCVCRAFNVYICLLCILIPSTVRRKRGGENETMVDCCLLNLKMLIQRYFFPKQKCAINCGNKHIPAQHCRRSTDNEQKLRKMQFLPRSLWIAEPCNSCAISRRRYCHHQHRLIVDGWCDAASDYNELAISCSFSFRQRAMMRLNTKLLFFHALNHFQSIDFQSIELRIELLLLYYRAHTHTHFVFVLGAFGSYLHFLFSFVSFSA